MSRSFWDLWDIAGGLFPGLLTLQSSHLLHLPVRTSPLCGDRSALLLFYCYETRSSGPPFWPFLQSLETRYWTRMLVILAWVEFSVRSRMMRSVSSHIAASPSVHLSGNIAPQKERCWQLSPCVYSFVPIYVVLGSSSGRITSLLFGSIGLRIPRV